MQEDAPGVIEPGRLYLAKEARQRLKIGDKTWRDLKAQGLETVRVGKQIYVFSDDLLRLFREQQEQTNE